LPCNLRWQRSSRCSSTLALNPRSRSRSESRTSAHWHIRARAAVINDEIQAGRNMTKATATNHAVESLRAESRVLNEELGRIEAAIGDLIESLDNDRRYLNEIETLSIKFKRARSAKAVLSRVAFQACPRCAQTLPQRTEDMCVVCGQPDRVLTPDPTEEAVVDRDVKARSAELQEIIERHKQSLDSLRRQRAEIIARKEKVERERNEASADFDSAYLSGYLVKERERAALLQEADSLAGLVVLVKAVQKQREEIAEIEVRAKQIRERLKTAKEEAERDSQNIDRLKSYFLDCLLRAKIPGFKPDDIVSIPTNNFFPEITGAEEEEKQVTSFATISSGGKKNLFKACFAVALHRVAASLKAPLPEFLMIDSAMKNVRPCRQGRGNPGKWRPSTEARPWDFGTRSQMRTSSGSSTCCPAARASPGGSPEITGCSSTPSCTWPGPGSRGGTSPSGSGSGGRSGSGSSGGPGRGRGRPCSPPSRTPTWSG